MQRNGPPHLPTLSLHAALPISGVGRAELRGDGLVGPAGCAVPGDPGAAALAAGPAGPGHPARRDRKSTRLNSSHVAISYAVFCLKKKHQLITLLTPQCKTMVTS